MQLLEVEPPESRELCFARLRLAWTERSKNW
jgi:hypothetical protein